MKHADGTVWHFCGDPRVRVRFFFFCAAKKTFPALNSSSNVVMWKLEH